MWRESKIVDQEWMQHGSVELDTKRCNGSDVLMVQMWIGNVCARIHCQKENDLAEG